MAALGYDRPLYLLAFDHRGSFERDLFHAGLPLSEEDRARIVDAKDLIYAAFEEAVARGTLVPDVSRGVAGVLVDEEFGAALARRAKAAGHVLAMPVEKSGQQEFDFEYGQDFGRHIERFDPTFTKVLVRYNPEGEPDLNRRQAERLARLTRWLHDRDRKFLFELLVPPTAGQLERCAGDEARFDRELRPDLVVETLRQLQASGVEPDVWKIEGLDTREDCARVVAQARSGGRDGVRCIVLGRGADEARVLHWLRIAAGVPGFDGFAVGRTLWDDPLHAFLSGQEKRDQAVHAIADRYLETIGGFAPASSTAASSTAPSGAAATAAPPIRLLLADVDGTLVTNDKVLTDRATEAVRSLGAAGTIFAITSGRPPRGMSMLLEPLDLTTPIAAFNGGVFVRRDMSIMSQKAIPAEVVAPVIELLESFELGVWLYRGAGWFVRDLEGPHVDRERRTVRFDPTLVHSYAGFTDGIAKIVGVSDDYDAVTAATQAARERFGGHVSAAPSQPYYLDVTHPQANKGSVVKFLSATYQIPTEQIATIGDMPNDVLMFAHSGLSIAMGNASSEVQRAARHVTSTNQDEGFAGAVERFILPR